MIKMSPDFRFKELFQHKGRNCLIIEREKLPEDEYNFMMFFSAVLFNNPFALTFCAYVEMLKEVPLTTWDFEDLIHETETVSFVGKFRNSFEDHQELYEKFWIGFDTGLAHETQETNTFECVKERLKRFCDELMENGY